ncbi:unnamed protein product [Pocillopora meandrina]|uniref:G-protein coupled receptors family 1 profile domain-containing protein n=1 Tax=Pocillopora meandrina TaxID=46732 RepID=A0AAU9WUY5_9CNID|nr:unnamed protein product [Pocillopora meandrina]
MNDSQHTGNGTSRGDLEFIAITAILYVFIIIASLLGNIIVCVVILSTRSLRRSVNSFFILSLAVSDLTTTCVVIPFDLEILISGGKWQHGEVMCNVWTTTYLLAVPTSILSLLALTVYRYRLLQDPLDSYKSSPLITRRRALIVVCCLWGYSMLFSLVPVFGWKTYPTSVVNGYCYFNVSWIYSVLSSMINFVTPVMTASILNCRMFCLALKLSRKALREDFLLKKLQKRNSRAAKTTFLIVFSFVFCWFPHTLWSITFNICKQCFINVPYNIYTYVTGFFLVLGYLNSALNPILYSFRSPEFQKAVKIFLVKRSTSSNKHSGRKLSHPRLSITKSTSVDRETRL